MKNCGLLILASFKIARDSVWGYDKQLTIIFFLFVHFFKSHSHFYIAILQVWRKGKSSLLLWTVMKLLKSLKRNRQLKPIFTLEASIKIPKNRWPPFCLRTPKFCLIYRKEERNASIFYRDQLAFKKFN